MIALYQSTVLFFLVYLAEDYRTSYPIHLDEVVHHTMNVFVENQSEISELVPPNFQGQPRERTLEYLKNRTVWNKRTG